MSLWAGLFPCNEQVPVQRAPSKFRDTALETHKSLPPEQFGVAGGFEHSRQAAMNRSGQGFMRDSGSNAHGTFGTFDRGTARRRHTQRLNTVARNSSQPPEVKGSQDAATPALYSSVFRPRPEQVGNMCT
jgi:hypothetical protein